MEVTTRRGRRVSAQARTDDIITSRTLTMSFSNVESVISANIKVENLSIYALQVTNSTVNNPSQFASRNLISCLGKRLCELFSSLLPSLLTSQSIESIHPAPSPVNEKVVIS